MCEVGGVGEGVFGTNHIYLLRNVKFYLEIILFLGTQICLVKFF
jgi:hypothetical protein